MKLNQISNNPGAHKRKAKVGRGSSSGHGKTSWPRRQGRQGAHRAQRSTASKAARCRSICVCPSAASTTSSRATSRRGISVALQKAIDDKRLDAKMNDHRRGPAQGRPHPPKNRDGVRLLGARANDHRQARHRSGGRVGRGAREYRGGKGGRHAHRHSYKKKVYANKKGEPGKRQNRRTRRQPKKRAARQG